MFVMGHKKAVCELARVLGFDPNKTRKMVIEMEVDSVVSVKAEVLLEKEQLDNFTEILRKYKLVEIGTGGD